MALPPVPKNLDIKDPKVKSYFQAINDQALTFAPIDATYIVKTSNSDLTNEQALSSLNSGFVKVTTGTGTLSSVTGIVNADLDTTGVSAASYTINGSSLFAVNSQGRLTSASSATITVTGTSNQITVTGGTGTTPTISIATGYVGQTSLTTLGTISTGTWNATKIGLAYGGTNADLSATGGASQVLKQTSVGGNITVAQLAASDISVTKPTIQTFTSGSGTYTLPANCSWIEVELVGGGGGGSGSGSGGTLTSGSNGGNTTFGTSFLTGNGGAGGVDGAPVSGGTASGGDINIAGGNGGGRSTIGTIPGSPGAASYFGNAGLGGEINGGGGGSATGYGSGGGAAGTTATTAVGGSGAAGGYVRKIITSPSSTYSYAVGAGGSGGAAGTGGAAGGSGKAGIIIVREYYI